MLPISESQIAKMSSIANVDVQTGNVVAAGKRGDTIYREALLTHNGRWVDYRDLKVKMFPQPAYSTVQLIDGQTADVTFFQNTGGALDTAYNQTHIVRNGIFTSPDSFLVQRVQIQTIPEPADDSDRAVVTLVNDGATDFANINEFFRKAVLELTIDGNDLVFRFPADMAAGGRGWTGWAAGAGGETANNEFRTGAQFGDPDINTGGFTLPISVFIPTNTNFSLRLTFDRAMLFIAATDLLKVRAVFQGINSKSYA